MKRARSGLNDFSSVTQRRLLLRKTNIGEVRVMRETSYGITIVERSSWLPIGASRRKWERTDVYLTNADVEALAKFSKETQS